MYASAPSRHWKDKETLHLAFEKNNWQLKGRTAQAPPWNSQGPWTPKACAGRPYCTKRAKERTTTTQNRAPATINVLEKFSSYKYKARDAQHPLDELRTQGDAVNAEPLELLTQHKPGTHRTK